MAARSSGFRRGIAASPIAVFMLFLLSLTSVTSASAATAVKASAKPVYQFTVEVAVAQATADRAGGYIYALSKILNQIDHVNHAFNDPGVFRATYAFDVTQSHEYSDATSSEVIRPHTTNLKVIYDEDATAGGWRSDTHTITHGWPVSKGGDFASDATDGLVHEFGHFRGATDEYAGDVNAATNPVNGSAYRADNSVMSYPYGVHNWSAYSIGLINMQGSRVDEPSPALASKALPRLQVHAVSPSGKPIKARIQFYPVRWFSYSVDGTATVDKNTSATTGYYKFTTSPYKPASSNPWDLTYTNFLVRATYAGKTVYSWLPLATTAVPYFQSPTTPYTLQIHF